MEALLFILDYQIYHHLMRRRDSEINIILHEGLTFESEPRREIESPSSVVSSSSPHSSA